MAYSPFKMKGSPMQRNFGIGESPVKAIGKDKDKKKEEEGRGYTYVEDPKRERTDKHGRTQKEVMEMRHKKEDDSTDKVNKYTGKVNKYSEKHGGLTDEKRKKAKGKINKLKGELNKLKGETKYSQDSITGVNKQLAAKALAELNAKKKKKKEADDEFDAL